MAADTRYLFSRKKLTRKFCGGSRVRAGGHGSAFVLTVLVLLSLTISCTSRYRMDLYMTLDEQRGRVKVEQSSYIENSRLNLPNAENKIVRGTEAVAVFETGARGKLVQTATSNLFGYDEYLRCKVFVQLSPALTPGEIAHKELSFVQILGRFELPAETKLFTYQEGSLAIDSVAGNNIYLSLGANFRNNEDKILSVEGAVKIRKR